MREYETGGTCSTQGRETMYAEFRSKNLMESSPLHDLGIGGKIMC